MNKQDLLPFCSTDPCRYSLSIPWNIEGFTYASDGKALIRVPAIAECERGIHDPYSPVIHPGTIPDADSPAWQDITLPDGWQDTPPVIIDCKACDGTGKIRDCPECGGAGETTRCECGNVKTCRECDGEGTLVGEGKPCEGCNGDGKTEGETLIPFSPGFSLRLHNLKRIATLPEWRLRHHPDNPTLRIDFTGGCGAIMAVRQRPEFPRNRTVIEGAV